MDFSSIAISIDSLTAVELQGDQVSFDSRGGGAKSLVERERKDHLILKWCGKSRNGTELNPDAVDSPFL